MRIRNWGRGILVLSGLLIAILFPLLVALAQGDGEKQDVGVSPPAHLEGLTKISQKRLSMDPQLDFDCATAVSIPVPAGKKTPHEGAYILVYANDLVVKFRKLTPEGVGYPVGSVLLKEKYSDAKIEQAHLATIMRKIGDEGTIEDWDFSVIELPSGKASPMTANDKAACADCHANFKGRGYVSSATDYLLARLAEPATAAPTNKLTVIPEKWLPRLPRSVSRD